MEANQWMEDMDKMKQQVSGLQSDLSAIKEFNRLYDLFISTNRKDKLYSIYKKALNAFRVLYTFGHLKRRF